MLAPTALDKLDTVALCITITSPPLMMSETFPSQDVLETMEQFDLNYAYEISDDDRKCVEQVESEDHDDYELFAIGCRMASMMSGERKSLSAVRET